MGRTKGPEMLKVIGGAILFGAWWVVIGFAVLLLAGCDLLVSDNPLCEYDCSVNSTRSVGGAY